MINFSTLDYTEINEHEGYVKYSLFNAIFIYSAFAVLDYFMLPINFTSAWLIRAIMAATASFLLFFNHYWIRHIIGFKYMVTVLIGMAQLGIAIIQYKALPSEPASLSYYIGYILIIVYAAFIFKLSSLMVIINILLALFLFNSTLWIKEHTVGITPAYEYYLLNGNFHLVAAGILILTGSLHLNAYSKLLNTRNHELKKEKKSLQEANLRAKESDLLKAKFLANLSHEFRTPMNSIMGFSELINTNELSQQELRQFTNIIYHRSKELHVMLEDLICVSMIDARQIKIEEKPVDLNAFFRTKIRELKQSEEYLQKESRIRLTVEIDALFEQLRVLLDEYRLSQVIENLLSNAYKFTEKGEIILSCEQYDEFIVFKVKDTGTGMDKEVVNAIYNRFYKGNEANISKLYQGLGLGMVVVKSLVELMGGNLWIESEPEKGTDVRFILPYNLPDQPYLEG